MLPLVAFKQSDPPGPGVLAVLGNGIPVSSADGGWAVVSRPKWVGFVEWQGFDPYRLTIPIMLDGFADNRSIEQDYENLRRMMRPADTPRDRGPLVKIAGPVPFTYFTWVMTNIEYGDEIRRESDGARVRAFMTIGLLQYVAADVLISAKVSPAQQAQQRQATAPAPAAPGTSPTAPAAPSGRTYTVRSGDTLSKIAARELGSAARYREIASLNGIRDPNRINVGQVLRLP